MNKNHKTPLLFTIPSRILSMLLRSGPETDHYPDYSQKINHDNVPARPATYCSGRPPSQDWLSSGSSGGLCNVSDTSRPNNPTVPPASAQGLASPPPYADMFRPVGISTPPTTVEDPIDGQNAAIEGTNPGRGPTTGGIETWIYGTNLPNGSTPL